MTLPTSTDLLPCPFCGGDAVCMTGEHGPYVECESCDVRTTSRLRAEGAAKNWNRRAALAASAQPAPAKIPLSDADYLRHTANNMDATGDLAHRARLHAIADALAAQPALVWQPIAQAQIIADPMKTAPPQCLVYGKGYGVCMGTAWRWSSGETVATINNVGGSFLDGEGVSHWASLPAAPAQGEAA